VNDSDSDNGSFSELSNSETHKANSPFSSSSSEEAEEEIVQLEPDRGRKRTCRAIPKRANTDLELGWMEKICKIQKPAFSGVPGINKIYQITQDSSPLDILEIFFSIDLLKHTQNETSRYAAQQIKKKKQGGPLKSKSVFAQWNPVTLQEIKKFFLVVIHMSM
jgi:hypothetical protein